jgi:hypothetical protein
MIRPGTVTGGSHAGAHRRTAAGGLRRGSPAGELAELDLHDYGLGLGEELAPGAWQPLEALPDPRSPQRRIYPLACLIAIAVCAFTAAGNDRFTAVGQWIKTGWPGRPGPAARSVGPDRRPVPGTG